MAVLHWISRSPGESLALAQCLARVGSGDVVVLLEGGVYAGLDETADAASLQQAMAASVTVYAVAADLAVRGIAEAELADGVGVVDYAGLVQLSVTHAPVMAWR